ncbi:tRNA(Met) cytidine acetyltransferase TmcA [Vibrio sp. NTOU-M3]|uniref:tRNA(Met) cytidine acetyltransferase TmcA n=1 Tax=Vibrio sp. NTOU-M3 TaxID=3234954 RepID=UPI00349F834C
MSSYQLFFSQLLSATSKNRQRAGLVLKGSQAWQQSRITELLELFKEKTVFVMGECHGAGVTKQVSIKKGQFFLGQECQLLICDFSDDFDANSFSAALGALVGGGILIVLPPRNQIEDGAQKWMGHAFSKLISVVENKSVPEFSCIANNRDTQIDAAPFSEQKLAIEHIVRVVIGHRKRPLVMTADRGRGKSSALGLASAELMLNRAIHIVITAPSLASVTPVFEHAASTLSVDVKKKGVLEFGDSKLEFIAPDEIVRTDPECDLLLVDEASSIPIPMLKNMVARYHRMVFSTTIHGYEGCGRGFSLKFQTWLKENRSGSRFYHLQQPIRWMEGDFLEQWLYQTFLLDAELNPPSAIVPSQCTFREISKSTLLTDTGLLRACFALLVNAHYQTSPNDLMLLLRDPAISVFILEYEGQCVGCILTVKEGELEAELINDVQQGSRRPKGHLVPLTIANHLGIKEAATIRSLRVMRIAVHPELQQSGLGSLMLHHLKHDHAAPFLSTSFGATPELIQFWHKNGYRVIRIGSQRDQASGCHSIIMVQGNLHWIDEATNLFSESLPFLLSGILQYLESDMVRNLWHKMDASGSNQRLPAIVDNYLDGGASYDSVAFLLVRLLKAEPVRIVNATDLVIRKLLQHHSWQDCVSELGFTGQKQAEAQFRSDIHALIRADGFTL